MLEKCIEIMKKGASTNSILLLQHLKMQNVTQTSEWQVGSIVSEIGQVITCIRPIAFLLVFYFGRLVPLKMGWSLNKPYFFALIL